MENIHPTFDKLLSRSDRERFLSQRAKTVWLTGLSGSGKSTIAIGLERRLFEAGYLASVLDGDNTRAGLNQDLGFSLADRQENIRRVAEVSKLFNDGGVICINSFITPTDEIRGLAEEIIGADNFILVFVDASLRVCEERDVKGLYKKAKQGELKDFTGLDSDFAVPKKPALAVDTDKRMVEESVSEVFEFIASKIKLTTD